VKHKTRNYHVKDARTVDNIFCVQENEISILTELIQIRLALDWKFNEQRSQAVTSICPLSNGLARFFQKEKKVK